MMAEALRRQPFNAYLDVQQMAWIRHSDGHAQPLPWIPRRHI